MRRTSNLMAVWAACFTMVGMLPAKAMTAAEQAREAGLLGWWASDCAKPPSEDNEYFHYKVSADGRLIHTRVGEHKRTEIFELKVMRHVSEQRYEIRFISAGHRYVATLEIIGDVKQTITMTVNGLTIVENNSDLDGESIGAEQRCDAPSS